MDTHSQSIRADPEIHLAGEVDANDHDRDDRDVDDDGENNESDDGDDEDELADLRSGMKRKAATRTENDFPAKVTKTVAEDAPSTAALNVIDDRRPDLTLIDLASGEDPPFHPYGRHSCIYIEVKVDQSKKPNPQDAVCPLFL